MSDHLESCGGAPWDVANAAKNPRLQVENEHRIATETLRTAVQGAIDTWSQYAEDAEEWNAIKALCNALADTAPTHAATAL